MYVLSKQICFNFFVLLFWTPCLVETVQPCMEWIPIKTKNISISTAITKSWALKKKHLHLSLKESLWNWENNMITISQCRGNNCRTNKVSDAESHCMPTMVSDLSWNISNLNRSKTIIKKITSYISFIKIA